MDGLRRLVSKDEAQKYIKKTPDGIETINNLQFTFSFYEYWTRRKLPVGFRKTS